MSHAYLVADCTIPGAEQAIDLVVHERGDVQHWQEPVSLVDGRQEVHLEFLPGLDEHEHYVEVEFTVVDDYPELHRLEVYTTDDDKEGPVDVASGALYEGPEGSIELVADATDLAETGITRADWLFWNDLYLYPHNPLTLNVGPKYDTTATVEHVTGEEVLSFNLASREPDGTCDIEVRNLKPNAWYRLQFEGTLAACAGGRAHGQTDDHGRLRFNEVVIPN